MRVLVIDSVIHRLNNEQKTGADHTTLSQVINKICEMHTGLLKVKCYNNFPNALSHRQRHRLLTLLLVLLSHIVQVCAADYMDIWANMNSNINIPYSMKIHTGSSVVTGQKMNKFIFTNVRF